MQIPATFLDNVVVEIVKECDHVTPPLSADEIAHHVLDAISDQLQPEVYASLERLAMRGLLQRDRSGRDVLRYRAAPQVEGELPLSSFAAL